MKKIRIIFFSLVLPGLLAIMSFRGLKEVSFDAAFFSSSSCGPITTVSSRVSANNDDAEERVSDGNIDRSSTDLELIRESSDQIVGMRFSNLTIPQGAIIVNAYIEFEVDETSSGTTNLTFYGEDIDDAPEFSNTDYDISSRTQTSASASWNSVPAWNTESEKKQTPDLSGIIKEIVDRPGWTSNNDMVIIVEGSGSRVAESYDGESANAPLLVVEYQLSGSNPNCPCISALGNSSTICSGDTITQLEALVDTPYPDSIAFVYFSAQQTDSSVIYASGTGLDTVDVGAGNDTARITNLTWPENTGSSAINYYVYAISHPPSDSVWCRPYAEFTITVNPGPSQSVTSNSPVCLGERIELYSSGGGSYSWAGPNSFTASVDSPAVKVAEMASAGVYSVTVTHASSCSIANSTTVVVNSNPTADAGPDTLYCGNSAVQLSASGGTTYSWVPAAGLSNASVSNPTASPTNTTRYSLTVTDGNGCTDTDVIRVVVGNQNICLPAQISY